MPAAMHAFDELVQKLEEHKKMMNMDKEAVLLTLMKVNEGRFGYSNQELIAIMQDFEAQLKNEEQV